MNTRYFITAILSCALFFSSCDPDEFLEEKVYNRIVGSEFYATPSGIDMGVNGIYSRLRDWHGWNFTGVMTELADLIRDGNHIENPWMNYDLTTDAGHINRNWEVAYTTINQANDIINILENVDIPDLPEPKRLTYLAEVRFMRSHMYKQLILHWGDVDLRTKPTVGLDLRATRTPKAEIWDFIISELEWCIDNLPESVTRAQTGRITKYAASHELARVLLYVGRENSAIVQKAITLLESIINSGHYSLVEDHFYLYHIDNQKNSEIIWAIQFTDDMALNQSGNTWHTHFNCSYAANDPSLVDRSIDYGRPWSRLQPSFYLQGLYNEETDHRWAAGWRNHWTVNQSNARSVQFNPWTKEMEEIQWDIGDTVFMQFKQPIEPTPEMVLEQWPVWVYVYPEYDKWGVKIGTITPDMIQGPDNPDAPYPSNTKIIHWGRQYPGLKKYLDPRRPTEGHNNSGRDKWVYRLADTYLLAAEGYYLLGNTEKSAEYVNIIRDRGAWPGKEEENRISASDIDIDFLLDERGRELVGEGLRWADLKRNRKLLEYLGDPNRNSRLAERFQAFHYFRPIPQQFLDLIENPEDFPQNEGY